MGLPTPNLFAGGHNPHSEREWICIEELGLATMAVIELAKSWAEDGRQTRATKA
jgi:tripeptide aminopeptidase